MCECCNCIERCPSISLQEWYEAMCVNPYYGFQLAQPVNGNARLVLPLSNTPCAELIYEDSTQGGQISGRRWIWNAILASDEKFRNFAGYWPVPTQECDEYHFQKPYTSGTIRLKTGKIKALGEYVYDILEEIDLGDSEFLDLNGDTVLDTVRITTTKPMSVGDLDEIVLFMAEEDREFVDTWCRSQIRPVKVSEPIEGTLRIDIPIWNLVRPVLYRGYSTGAIDPNDVSNYVSKVVIYRKWIDDTRAITIMRRTDVDCACSSDATECYDCENVDACIVNAQAGIIRVDMRNNDKNSCYCSKCAHRMCIKYIAGDCGYPDLISRMAAAELRGDICCGTSPEVRYWQADYIGVDSRGRVTTSLLVSEQGNPFGTKRGQVEAYRYLRERRSYKAIRI